MFKLVKFISLFIVMLTFADSNANKCLLQQPNIKEINSVSTYSSDKKTTYSNMVNCELKKQTITYEEFDENYYIKENQTNTSIASNDLLINPANIIGSDNRSLVDNPKVSPYLPTAYIETTYLDIFNNSTNRFENVSYAGTAFLEGSNLAVTAAHCLFYDVTVDEFDDGESNPRFPDKIELYFGCSGKEDFEMGTEYKYYAAGESVSIELNYYENKSTSNRDWGVIHLDRNIGDAIGWYGKISNFKEKKTEIYSWGYPVKNNTYGSMYKTIGAINDISNGQYLYEMDTEGGQSGSPIFVKAADGNVYVCGIHISGSNSTNYGMMIDSFIFAYLNGFVDTFRDYDFLRLSISTKIWKTWHITIHNDSDITRVVTYNTKMCNYNDGKNWANLNDTKEICINPNSSYIVYISENWFATTIAISYMENNKRIITYADNLNKNSLTLKQHFSVI